MDRAKRARTGAGGTAVLQTHLLRQVVELRQAIERLHMQAPHLRWDALQQHHAAIMVKLDVIFKLLHSTRAPQLPQLASLVLAPRELSTEVSTDLQKLTHGRVSVFAHNTVPTLLRTKILPEMEETRATLQSEAAASEAQVSADDVIRTNDMVKAAIFGGDEDDDAEGFLDEINRYVAARKKEGRTSDEDRAVLERQAAIQSLKVLHDALEHGKGL
eukprot:m.56321 g.56321  ORF g.56321 m.56321 type:complete len:216 (-) comp16956_c0_seq1:34-681(-)